MQVEVTCRHGSINDTLHEYTVNKAEKLLTYFERVTAIQVTFSFDNGRVGVEILVDAEHKHNFVAHQNDGEDAQATFDSAFHKMEAQIKKYKEKIQDHRRDVPMNEIVDDQASD